MTRFRRLLVMLLVVCVAAVSSIGFAENVESSESTENVESEIIEMAINPQFGYVGPKLVCAYVEIYTMLAQAVHGYTLCETVNFDITTGGKLDLSRYTDDYDALVLDIVASLKESLSKLDYLFDEPDVIIKGTDVMNQGYFSQDGYVVYFNPYDIAPYSYGIQYIGIPYDVILPHLNELGHDLFSLVDPGI